MTNTPPQLDPVSPAEAAVLHIAQRETAPDFAAEFEPITKGFLFAVISLGALGCLAACCLVWRTLTRAFSGGAR
ncbi:MAG: hypothetical protein ABI759_06810 [Candidatus Solibacter sp.]